MTTSFRHRFLEHHKNTYTQQNTINTKLALNKNKTNKHKQRVSVERHHILSVCYFDYKLTACIQSKCLCFKTNITFCKSTYTLMIDYIYIYLQQNEFVMNPL